MFLFADQIIWLDSSSDNTISMTIVSGMCRGCKRTSA